VSGNVERQSDHALSPQKGKIFLANYDQVGKMVDAMISTLDKFCHTARKAVS
jgi:hypothetical protein